MRSLPAFIAALALALPLRVAAEEGSSSELTHPEAIEHFKRGQAHFATKNYVKAAEELKAAYAFEATPQLLYAWAQAERFAGNCTDAVPLYERFLDSNPHADARQATEENIQYCASRGDTNTDPRPDPDPDPDPDTPDDDGPKPPGRDWLAPTFIGLGVAVGVAGGVLIGIGRQEVLDSPGAVTEDNYFDEVDTGRQKHTAGIVLASVGGALILAGVIRYAVLAGKYRKHRKQPSTSFVPGGRSGLGLQVRF